MKTPFRTASLIPQFLRLIVVALCFFAANCIWAMPIIYVGTNSVSATTNWSDTANFVESDGVTPHSPVNNATTFGDDTAVASPGGVTVHVDGGYGTPGTGTPSTWAFLFEQTNSHQTVLIDPGIQLQMIAGNGTPGNGFYVIPGGKRGGGGGTLGTPLGFPYTNYTTVEGAGSLLLNGHLQVEAQASTNLPHYSILDMSKLNTFIQTNTSGGSSRFELGDGTERSQSLIYLATNNFINIYSDMQIGYIGDTYSNSLPIGLYLGMSNVITTGPNDNGNQLEIAMQGVTNAFMKFNPVFLGAPTKPTVYLSGNGAASGNGGFPTVNGVMAGAIIGDANGASVPSYGVADFTGGKVTWNLGQLDLGLAGTTNFDAAATGILTFDDGTITVNSVLCGDQLYDASGANGASPGVGIINIGTNATLQVNNTLQLAVTTNTPAPGTAGTINVNGGMLAANIIADGGGTATITLTNATLQLTVTPGNTGSAKATIPNLITGGTTNIIAIKFSTPATSYPFTNRLVSYTGSIGGAGFNFGLQITNAFTAQLVNNSANHEIDLVVDSGPVVARNLTWSGTAGNGNWDVGTTANWLNNDVPTTYNQSDLVRFDDTATGTTNVNLTTVLTPSSLIISNNLLTYTFGDSGYISGAVGLDKEGSGTLILDEAPSDNYTGGVSIGSGTVQVGNNDTGGHLPSGAAVNNNGALIFDHTDSITVDAAISGPGSLTQEGAGGTLQLSGVNTFTGPVFVTNGSVLQVGGGNALGTGTNGVTVASGSTLDANGNALANPIIVSGAGVSGNGAIVNSGGAIYSSSGGLTPDLILAGDTTLGIANRWDLSGGVLNSGGQPYNLTLNGGSSVYFQWANETVDTNLGNITLASGTFGIVGSTMLGNPTYTLNLAAGSTLDLYGPNVSINKLVDVQSGATVENASGANVMSGAMTLEGGYPTFNIANHTSLTLSGVLSGSGVFYQTGGAGTAILSGNSPSFTGGVYLYNGQLMLNGLIGSGITSLSGTTLSGAGTANGLVDVSGALMPGGAGVAGTFTAAGGLTLESGATLTMNLGSTTGIGGGTNSLIAVTGDLTANGNNFTINPINGTLAAGTYTLFTYTGTLSGSFGTVSTASPSRYSFALDTSTPHQVKLVVTGHGDALLWNNGANNGEWDVQNSLNWSNLTTHAEDQFLDSDSVLFDDSILNAAHPTTSIDIASGQAVMPGVITNNSAANYTISGAGKISGGGSLVKLGVGTLTLSTTNDFTGNFSILGGAVQINGQIQPTGSPVGATNGTLSIANGATLLVNLQGSYPAGDIGFGSKPIVVSGVGTDGNGAIQNIGNAIYSGSSTPGGLDLNVTLAGNTTIGGTARWDWGYPGLGATLSTRGSNYNLTAIEPGYSQWQDLTIDTNLGNIDFYTTASSPQQWRVSGMGESLGNPTNVLTLHSNMLMHIVHGDTAAGDNGYAKVIRVMPTAEFRYQPSGGAGDYRLKTSFIMEDGSSLSFYSGNGGSNSGTVINGTVALNGLAHLQIGDSTVTFSNVISGTGGFYWDNYNNTVAFAATNTYQGITDIRSGRNLALIGNGSISDSTNISLASSATLAVTNRTDGTLTLASGQTLQGSGAVVGMLVAAPGSILAPGAIGVTGMLTVSSNATVSGTTLLKLNGTANDALSVGGVLTYGGVLTLTNISATPLAAGDSFTLFSAGSYNGSFTNILPAIPGTGLAWDTSNLAVNGTISVVSTVAPSPRITTITLNGTTLTIQGTNGTASGQYVLLQSTNVALPLNQWTPALTNSFDTNGDFNLSTNIVNPNNPQKFYILETQ